MKNWLFRVLIALVPAIAYAQQSTSSGAWQASVSGTLQQPFSTYTACAANNKAMAATWTKHAEEYQRKSEHEDLAMSDLDMNSAQLDMMNAQSWAQATCTQQ